MSSNHKFTEDLHKEMGVMSSFRWEWEPLGVLFMLARYKWVAKMLANQYPKVLEIGCGDGFGSRLVAQAAKYLICIDKDQMMIDSAKKNQSKWNIEFRCTEEIEDADVIYALDVMEHIEYKASNKWLGVIASHAPVCIIGMPSYESQRFASQLSKENHINCLSQAALRMIMKNHYKNVFMFSMNDEIVHTGHSGMSHYNFALGIN